MFNNIYVRIIAFIIELYIAKIGQNYRGMIIGSIGYIGHMLVMFVIGIMVYYTVVSFKRASR